MTDQCPYCHQRTDAEKLGKDLVSWYDRMMWLGIERDHRLNALGKDSTYEQQNEIHEWYDIENKITCAMLAKVEATIRGGPRDREDEIVIAVSIDDIRAGRYRDFPLAAPISEIEESEKRKSEEGRSLLDRMLEHHGLNGTPPWKMQCDLCDGPLFIQGVTTGHELSRPTLSLACEPCRAEYIPIDDHGSYQRNQFKGPPILSMKITKDGAFCADCETPLESIAMECPKGCR